MSQTARVKTVINDFAAAKKACEALGWGFHAASEASIDLEINGSRGVRMEKTGDVYTVTGNFNGGGGQNKVMAELNKKYAEVKLFKEIAERSDHGIISTSDPIMNADGTVTIECEVDETLLVG